MRDSERNKRVLLTINNNNRLAKREERRRLSSISYYFPTKDVNFGSLFELVRFWETQAKNRKPAEKSNFFQKEGLLESQPIHEFQIRVVEPKETGQKPKSARNNCFRVRFSTHAQKFKTNRPRRLQQAKVQQLNVNSKTINERTQITNKQIDKLVKTNQRLKSFRDSSLNKAIKVQKEIFQEDFGLTPW